MVTSDTDYQGFFEEMKKQYEAFESFQVIKGLGPVDLSFYMIDVFKEASIGRRLTDLISNLNLKIEIKKDESKSHS
jgi:hypothetical protein